MKKVLILVLVVAALLALTFVAQAQPYPSGKFCSFRDSMVTYNGQLAPVGSIIRAYDPDGVLSGVDTVGVDPDNPAGYYGFMPVYGDDPTTPSFDEGAVNGDSIRFTINGRPASVVEGDPFWVDQAQNFLRLSASATVTMTVTETPTDKAATFNRVVVFRVGVRNDGDGLDFYHIRTDHSDTSFHSEVVDSFVYANPGQTVYVDFEVRTPIFASSPDDTVDVISFHVNSGVDTTQSYDGSVQLALSITDVDDGGGKTLPGSFALYQNYPNPFNPSTKISYDLPRASQVRLEVFDALGRLVEEQDLGRQGAGEHAVVFNGTNLASGIYFYRLTTDSGSQSKKMLLVK